MAITRVHNLGEALGYHLRPLLPPPPILTLEVLAVEQVEVLQVHQPSQRLDVPCCVWGCVVRSGVDQMSEYQHECVGDALEQHTHLPDCSNF